MNSDKQFEQNMDIFRKTLKSCNQESLEDRLNSVTLRYATASLRGDITMMALMYTFIIDIMEVLHEKYPETTVPRMAIKLYADYLKND